MYGVSCREAPGDMIWPCWTWVLVQLILHSADAITALHGGKNKTHVVCGTPDWGWRGTCAESGFDSCCFPSGGDLSLSVVDLVFLWMGAYFRLECQQQI